MSGGGHCDLTGTCIGRDCAARVGEAWWIVDPVAGTLLRAPPGLPPQPPGRFTGIARDGAGRVLLASADQAIHVVDPQTGAELARFPARVPPSRRFQFAECTPLVAGDGWIATLDHFRSTLALYTPEGAPRGVLHLDTVLHAGGDVVLAVQAAGSYLGVGTRDERVLTLKLDLTPGCGAPPS